MDQKEASNITYKGYKSTTLHLVLLAFFTGTGLLLIDKIDANTWSTSVLGILAGYVIRDGVSKIAEAYYGKKIAAMPGPVAPQTP